MVIDLANSPSFEDKAVLEFFQTSGKNLMAAEMGAGVKHHVALSIVGTDRLLESGYLRAKVAQEKIIRESGIPYTIVRSTQFLEFLGAIAQEGTVGGTARLSTGYLQPIASDDVADFVTDAALAAPANGIIEISGPERARLCDFVARSSRRSEIPAPSSQIRMPATSEPNSRTVHSFPVATGSVENLAVSMGHDGALLAHRSGTLRLRGPEVKAVSAVGAGDSFVVGMTFALAGRQNVEDAFMLGMAAGAAAVLTHGTQLCRREDVEHLHAQVMAERARIHAAGAAR